MCGIAGTLTFDGHDARVAEPVLCAMRDAMSHRGPDGAGAWISDDGRVGLAHRRLSIIDLSAPANQPMANEDGSLQIVFNGEIYNHAELRRELEAKGGHRWRTDHSDTEVILHAFEEWGIDCLARFRGMFAFALWDARRRDVVAGARSHRHQAALLRRTTTAGSRSPRRSRRCCRIPISSARCIREALYHYPVVPHHAGAADAVRRHQEAAGRAPGCGSRRAAASTEQRYWDVWDHTSPLTDAVGRGDRRARARRRCGPPCAIGRSATCRSACSCPAASIRAPTRRCSPKASSRRSRPSRSATRGVSAATRTSCSTPARWPSASAPIITSCC